MQPHRNPIPETAAMTARRTPNQAGRQVRPQRKKDAMNSALLIMDVQQGVVDRFGQPGLPGRLTHALTAARNTAVPVISPGWRSGPLP
jgi:hypothetical protein